MLNKERLGQEIKKIRKTKKMTQKELSFEICSQSEISRIESGDFFPGIDLLYLISTKLNTPLTHFFEVLTYEEVNLIKQIKTRVLDLSYKKDYPKLLSEIEKILKNPFPIDNDFEKFLLWKKYVSSYYLGKIDAENCRVELTLLVLNKSLGIDRTLDFYIQNSTANILAENHRYEESMVLYKKILAEIPSDSETTSLRIKVTYNLGKLLYLKQNFIESLDYTNQGIALSLNSSNMSLLGQFYYQKGSLLEELKFSVDEILITYNRALFFFELLNLNVHKEILLKNKSAFLYNN